MGIGLILRKAILIRKAEYPIAGLLVSGRGSEQGVLMITGTSNYYLKVRG